MPKHCAYSSVSALPFGSDDLTKRSQSVCERSHFSESLTHEMGAANV